MRYIRILVGVIVMAYGFSAHAQSVEETSPSDGNPKAAEKVKEAIRLEESGKFEEAIEKFKEVPQIEPKDFKAMNSIAGLYGVVRDPVQQVLWAQRSFDANSKYWQALINLGNGHAVQGKFDLASSAFNKAMALATKEPLPVYSLGVLAENRNQIRQALAHYLKSIELDPKFQNGLFSAAAMHASLRQFAEAKKLLTRLLEIEPRDQDARQMLAAIERDMAKR